MKERKVGVGSLWDVKKRSGRSVSLRRGENNNCAALASLAWIGHDGPSNTRRCQPMAHRLPPGLHRIP
jgi:hypothetical protein